MRLKLWLAQPETEKTLATALRMAVIVFACWGLVTASVVWNSRSALATSQAMVMSQGKKLAEAGQGIPRKRAEAAKAVRVRISATPGATGADLTDELSRVSVEAGTEIAGVRIGDGGQGKAAAQSNTAQTPANPSSATPSSAAPVTTSGGLDQETFECNISGEYRALTRFLKALASSSYVLDVTSVEVTQAGTKSGASTPRLEMKLSGIVYELPEKQ